MTPDQIKEILVKHRAWRLGEPNGVRADLTGANLTGAYLGDADLTGANLTGAYLGDAEIPVVTSLHRATLGAIENGGRLDMSTWHAHDSCGTTHCRAGWAVNLAGKEGLALEQRIGTAAAAALIIVRSCPHLDGKVPDFYATNRDALADIQRCAAIEAAAEGAQP